MEMQFDRIPVAYLQKLTDGVRTQEETVEVRLPDGMPDIGRVLGAWGQVILRGKEWGSDSMTVSCGVMVWVLYTPEDEEGVRSVEAWLPFSMRWEMPESRYDGKISVYPMLKNVDARSTSARKLMVRATLCADAKAWQSAQAQTAVPPELPQDIQLLTATYPALLPKEAGEKPFLLEEELNIANMPKPEKLLYYTLQPEITDQKVMAGRIVYRGNAAFHLLYRGEDGKLHIWDYELPFSQYADLDTEFENDAVVEVHPCVTSLDVALDENGQLQLKAGLLGQYLVYDRTMITVAEDAYSPNRKLELICEQLQLPAVLDRLSNHMQAEKTIQEDVAQVVDVTFHPTCLQREYTEDGAKLILPGQFQMLYYDETEQLRGMQIPWDTQWNIPASKDSKIDTQILNALKPQTMVGAGNVTMRAEIAVDATVTSDQGISQLIGLKMGDIEKPDPNRPSLILCRKGDRRLWDVAKETGSTVEAIWQANGLEAEPENSQILLIPVK